MSGKGKRGAQLMGLESPVCIITCSDGSKYTILAGIQGKLVEVSCSFCLLCPNEYNGCIFCSFSVTAFVYVLKLFVLFSKLMGKFS